MITTNDVAELRLSADKAGLNGRPDAYTKLHELLDAYEAQQDDGDRHETGAEALDQEVSDLQGVVADLEHEVKSLKRALSEITDLARRECSSLGDAQNTLDEILDTASAEL